MSGIAGDKLFTMDPKACGAEAGIGSVVSQLSPAIDGDKKGGAPPELHTPEKRTYR